MFQPRQVVFCCLSGRLRGRRSLRMARSHFSFIFVRVFVRFSFPSLSLKRTSLKSSHSFLVLLVVSGLLPSRLKNAHTKRSSKIDFKYSLGRLAVTLGVGDVLVTTTELGKRTEENKKIAVESRSRHVVYINDSTNGRFTIR